MNNVYFSGWFKFLDKILWKDIELINGFSLSFFVIDDNCALQGQFEEF